MNLSDIRNTAERALLVILAVHVPVMLLAAWFVSPDQLLATGLIGLIPLVVVLGMRKSAPGSAALRITFGAAIMLQVAGFLFVFSGHPWQLDMHMYFFAALGILAAFACWQTIIAATAVVAVHHLALNFILPAAVFPGGGDFFRVVLHAVILLLETAALIYLTHRLVAMLEQSEHTANEARDASQRLKEETEARQAAEASAEARRIEDSRETANRFEDEIGTVVSGFGSNVAHLQTAAANMRNQAEQTGNMSKTVAQIIAESKQNVQSVAAAVEELSASISEISSQTERANTATSSAVEQARLTEGKILDLSEAAGRIGDVVNMINEIAEQTNLLALNATIEAARAGESGKGFAVVASEVKNLAQQTANATSEIVDQVQSVQSSVGDTSEAIRQFVTMIDQIAVTEANISEAVAEQKSATIEIADIIQRTARGSEEVADQAETMQSLSSDSANASGKVEDLAKNLEIQRNQFTDQIETFVGSLREGSNDNRQTGIAAE